MKVQKSFWMYLCLALLAGIIAALLVLPMPKERGSSHTLAQHRQAPAYHHIEQAPNDLLHRFFEVF